MNKALLIFLLTSFTGMVSAASLSASSPHDDQNSFAQEYKNLRVLLQSVKDQETALRYKASIEKEVQSLRQSQTTGSQQFSLLSEQEKKQFVQRFQKNRFHCGEVTLVMDEKRRILIQPKLAEILADSLAGIP